MKRIAAVLAVLACACGGKDDSLPAGCEVVGGYVECVGNDSDAFTACPERTCWTDRGVIHCRYRCTP